MVKIDVYDPRMRIELFKQLFHRADRFGFFQLNFYCVILNLIIIETVIPPSRQVGRQPQACLLPVV